MAYIAAPKPIFFRPTTPTRIEDVADPSEIPKLKNIEFKDDASTKDCG